jgi:uncharacterized protein YaaW (UPF0174 family)
MKKNKLKPLNKPARKTAVEAIKLSLVAELKEVTGILGAASKKLDKEIEKGARQLAKRLAKKLKIDTSAALPAGTAVQVTEKSVKETVPAKAKPEKVV